MAIASPIRTDDARDGAGSGTATRTPSITLEDLWEHHDYVRAVSRRIVGDAATAEDIVQETFMRAMRHLDDLDPEQSLKAWLATVARRCSIDELRRQARHATPVEDLPENSQHASGLVDALVQRDTLDAARRALANLKPREQRLLLARVSEGRTMAELAEEEGTTVRAVESVLNRARAKLAAAVDRGAAWAGAPVAALLRSLKRRAIDRSLESADAERGDDLAPAGLWNGRAAEITVAGVAAVAIVAGLVMGAAGDPDTATVKVEGRSDISPPLPMFGPEHASPRADVDRAAAPRSPLSSVVDAVHPDQVEPDLDALPSSAPTGYRPGWRGWVPVAGPGNTGPGPQGTAPGTPGGSGSPEDRNGTCSPGRRVPVLLGDPCRPGRSGDSDVPEVAVAPRSDTVAVTKPDTSTRVESRDIDQSVKPSDAPASTTDTDALDTGTAGTPQGSLGGASAGCKAIAPEDFRPTRDCQASAGPASTGAGPLPGLPRP